MAPAAVGSEIALHSLDNVSLTGDAPRAYDSTGTAFNHLDTGGMTGNPNEYYLQSLVPALQVAQFGFVPEPSSVALAAFGIATLCAFGWRRRKR